MTRENETDIYAIGDASNGYTDLLAHYDSMIPPIYSAEFPPEFQLAPLDWYLRPETVHRPLVTIDGEVLRQIGTMDVEFLNNSIVHRVGNGTISLAGRYPCGLKCPGCFSEDRTYLDAKRLMTWQEVFTVIDDARRIGLRSIKFLGPGELFQNPDLFDILDAAEKRGLPISIFTKGAELGDDDLARQVYGTFGITSASDLVARVADYGCVRILLGFNSFDPHRQDRMIGSFRLNGNYQINDGVFVRRGVERYTEKRNRALVALCEAGFPKNQRLSLIAAPIRLDQIDEVTEMYVWAARRNIPLVIAPTMELGPKAVGLMRYDQRKDPAHERLENMYVSVYSRAIEEGILSLERIERDGISAYMGTAACNQVANGLFLRLNGQVQTCPGSRAPETIFENVHQTSIVEIWKNSSNYKHGPLDNNWCQAKTVGMPASLQSSVLTKLQKKYGSESDANPNYVAGSAGRCFHSKAARPHHQQFACVKTSALDIRN